MGRRRCCASASISCSATSSSSRSKPPLDYDDLVLRTRQLLQDPDSASWVLYKLDGGIDHVLIDEAQDTNPDQWEVASLLTGEFFAGLGTVERPRTVFAVGDAKQSIFGFQRADPRKLAAMRETFGGRSRDAGQEFRKVDLIDSFRSTEAVLTAVDLVFATPPASDGVVADGSTIEHLAIRAGEAGARSRSGRSSPTAAEGRSRLRRRRRATGYQQRRAASGPGHRGAMRGS